MEKDFREEEWDEEDLLNEQQQKEAKEFRELFFKDKKLKREGE